LGLNVASLYCDFLIFPSLFSLGRFGKFNLVINLNMQVVAVTILIDFFKI
jgi:hypothetical protein